MLQKALHELLLKSSLKPDPLITEGQLCRLAASSANGKCRCLLQVGSPWQRHQMFLSTQFTVSLSGS